MFMNKIRLALAEDYEPLARSIQEKLEIFSHDIKFKFRASNSRELLEKLDEDHNVDIILMDIEMPEIDGIRGTELVKQKYPQIKIIMLTVFDDEEKIFKSILAGATGYLLKDETPEKIHEGILTVFNGGASMSPSIAMKTLKILKQPSTASQNESVNDMKLSVREIQVLEQLSQGLVYQKIADNLFIAPATVRKHIENIYEKLNVHNKMQAVQKALKHHII